MLLGPPRVGLATLRATGFGAIVCLLFVRDGRFPKPQDLRRQGTLQSGGENASWWGGRLVCCNKATVA